MGSRFATGGTAVVRLAIAGASVTQIAAASDYSLKDAVAILDALGRDIQLDRLQLR
ncbi:hypothetical protein [Bradyrhizobium sp. NAS80.1]|uniref:hypothetical protein n=1 Tax=Bradyrhizobium sp. NAS80.1 TaxID=1680159 RepID=UPI000A6F0972|nr:hypothetical protein [Bradyrhizobium sp. NAS80.1]